VCAAKERLALLNESDRHRVAIEFSVAGLDGGDDGEDNVQDPKDGQENEAQAPAIYLPTLAKAKGVPISNE
jgi:hypothetical protein